MPHKDDQEAAVLNMRDVSYHYTATAAASQSTSSKLSPGVNQLNLSIPKREFLGIIGPNGGGKSTMLKLILGLLKPDQGQVQVMGGTPRDARHHMGYVPQQHQINQGVAASVLDVVLSGLLRQSRWGYFFGSKSKQLAMAALERTGTADFASRKLSELSGGERQRVLIARAIVGGASILLLDEPMTGIDPQAEKDIIDLLARLKQDMAILMVSHDISMVISEVDRVACLNKTLFCCAPHQADNALIGRIFASSRAVLHDHECSTHDHNHDISASAILPITEAASDQPPQDPQP